MTDGHIWKSRKDKTGETFKATKNKDQSEEDWEHISKTKDIENNTTISSNADERQRIADEVNQDGESIFKSTRKVDVGPAVEVGPAVKGTSAD